MSISVCPVAVVHAPLERTWAVLMDPAGYGDWWNARTERIDPEGPAAPGQTIYASATAFGRRWPVTVHVVGVDAARHILDLRTELPLGILAANHIVCEPVDDVSCRVSFG
ncbi:MAG TPA: SRPBCC family protein [Ktedonobacterales bacterium]|jgi:hypothetical protein